MTTTAKRHKLHDLIDAVGDEEIEKLYSILDEQLVNRYKWWEDDEFVAELEQRVIDVETGKDKGFTWEEVKENARLSRQVK
jgi:hypothetical protein